jgi:hypothetical protein
VDGTTGVLGALLAPALVVAVSPFSIVVAALVLLHTDRPRANGVAFLVGRLLALAVVTAVFDQAPRLLGGFNRPIPPWLLAALGALLLAVGMWLWVKRDRFPTDPRWLARLSNLRPVGAAVIGGFLVLSNPKMLAASAAAGLVVGTSALAPIGAGLAVAYYCVVASSTVAAPVLLYLVVGARYDEQLTRLKDWIDRHNAGIGAGVMMLVGLALLAVAARGL